MFGWVIIFFSLTAIYFLGRSPRTRRQTYSGFISVFVAAYLGGLEMWLAILLRAYWDLSTLFGFA